MNRIGVLLLLALLLAGVLAFSVWVRAPHSAAPGWHTSMDRELAQVE
jgi:hypothetical protein